jgi:hypothetical protein
MATKMNKPRAELPQQPETTLMPWTPGQPLAVFVLDVSPEEDGSDDWFIIGPVAPLFWEAYRPHPSCNLAARPMWVTNDDVVQTGLVLPDGRIVDDCGCFYRSIEAFRRVTRAKQTGRHKVWKHAKDKKADAA